MNIHRLYARISPVFRRRRMRRFWNECKVNTTTLVLDVGGTEFNWGLLPDRPPLVLINRTLPKRRSADIRHVVGDARALPFATGTFPAVFSNSVIEHVGGPRDRVGFATEITRVGRSYFVQTPNRSFPIEPHLIAPFIHWLPRNWRSKLWFVSLRGWLNRQEYLGLVDEVRLLGAGEMRQLFPDAAHRKERVLGVAKSLLAIKVSAD